MIILECLGLTATPLISGRRGGHVPEADTVSGALPAPSSRVSPVADAGDLPHAVCTALKHHSRGLRGRDEAGVVAGGRGRRHQGAAVRPVTSKEENGQDVAGRGSVVRPVLAATQHLPPRGRLRGLTRPLSPLVVRVLPVPLVRYVQRVL